MTEDEASGSSPLARGLRQCSRFALPARRIIPARAGFTFMVADTLIETRDHPRSRGVYTEEQVDEAKRNGSSPLARGLPVRAGGRRGHQRIIPARAGFTDTWARPATLCGDHPRSRGVYLLRPGYWTPTVGSSPLARGLHLPGTTARPASRIIPARAGFTRLSRRCAPPLRDHPRSRGVYAIMVCSHQSVAGSSPLARGLLRLILSWRGQVGIIPARAGFTYCELWPRAHV